MFRSDWLRQLASKVAIPLLLLLLGGLVAGCFIWLGLQEELASRRDSQARSDQYAATKQNPEYNACARLPLIHREDCFAEAYEARRANQRGERDLIAQETTAAWTFITSIAALIGVVLSFFGVGLVWGTFHETRKTNEITREIGQAQVRAYPQIKSITIGHDGDNGCLVFSCEINNTGQSPAVTVNLAAEISLFSDDDTVDFVRHFVSMNITDIPIAGIGVPKIGLIDRKISASDFDQSIVCHVEMFIFATDVFRVPIEEHSIYHVPHTTPGAYLFGQNDRIPIPVSMLSPERLTMFRNNKVRRNRAD